MENINITVRGPKDPVGTYKNIVLKNNLGFGEQITESNAIYHVKWNYDLGGNTISMLSNCVLCMEGGKLSNGTLEGANTLLICDTHKENTFSRVEFTGTWDSSYKKSEIDGIITDINAELSHISGGSTKSIAQLDSKIDAAALPLKGKKAIFFGDNLTYFSAFDEESRRIKAIPDWFADYSQASCANASIEASKFVPRAEIPTIDPNWDPKTEREALAALDISNMVQAWVSGDLHNQTAAVRYLMGDGSSSDSDSSGDEYARYDASVKALLNNPIDTVDYVFICGGEADFTDASTIGDAEDSTSETVLGAIYQMVYNILVNKPTMKIYIVSPIVGYHVTHVPVDDAIETQYVWDDEFKNGSGKTKSEYMESISNRAKELHIPYIDLYWSMGWNLINFDTFFENNIPVRGFNLLAQRIYSQVKALS